MVRKFLTFDEFINENVNEGAMQKYILYADEFDKGEDGLGAMLDRMILLVCRGELKPVKVDSHSYTIMTTEDNYNKLLSYAKLQR